MNVIVSLTTTPIRAPHITAVIMSIIEQSYTPDKIVIGIPNEYKRFPGMSVEIPQWILKNPLIEIINLEFDYGPATKLIAGLQYAFSLENSNTLVVTVDDDINYFPGMLETLVRKNADFPKNILGYRGFSINESNVVEHPSRLCQPVDIIEGFSMTLYPCNIISLSEIVHFIKQCTLCDECFTSDDCVIHYFLKTKDIIKIAVDPRVTSALFTHKRLIDIGLQDDALHKGANGTVSSNVIERYLVAIKYLQKL
jgi:hypothetical protein